MVFSPSFIGNNRILLEKWHFINLLHSNHISYEKLYIVWYWWFITLFLSITFSILGKGPLRRSDYERRGEEYSFIHWSIHLGWSANLSKTLSPQRKTGFPGGKAWHYAFDTLPSFGILKPIGFTVSNRQCLIVFLSTEKKFLSRWQKMWKL